MRGLLIEYVTQASALRVVLIGVLLIAMLLWRADRTAARIAKRRPRNETRRRQRMNKATAELAGAKILVVDDEPSNTKLLGRILDRAGYSRVEIVNDPLTVKALHQANRFDLILLDIRMPNLDGFGVMSELKSVTVDDYVPIIVLTAATDDDTRLRALEMGAQDFATKPFEQTEILHRIRNTLEVRALYNAEKELREKTLAGKRSCADGPAVPGFSRKRWGGRRAGANWSNMLSPRTPFRRRGTSSWRPCLGGLVRSPCPPRFTHVSPPGAKCRIRKRR